MAGKQGSGHQGEVKDPAHDGRLKGQKGGEAGKAHEQERVQQKEQGQQSKGGSDRGRQVGGRESEGASRQNEGESSDLKAREYRDEDGNVHHHTKTYMEQHKGK
jgi:hypothetical protein